MQSLEKLTKAGACTPREMKLYTNADTVKNEDGDAIRYPIEMLNTLSPSLLLTDHMLSLMKEFIVVLFGNLVPKNGHEDGKRQVLESMTNNTLFLRIVTGMRRGAKVALPEISCVCGDDSIPVPRLKRLQAPRRFCFGTTTKKAKGQFIGDKLGIDLCEDIFSHVQLYAALLGANHRSTFVVLSETKTERKIT